MSIKNVSEVGTRFESEDRTLTDLDLEPVTSEDEDYQSAPPEYQILTYPADFTLEVLYQKWNAHEIDIPPFQRGFVWKQNQASKLIESFLVGLPVPPVFVYIDQTSQNLFVIDGQQRLKSIFYFFEGYFGQETERRRQVFNLTGLSPESRFYDKSFTELREEDQRRFKIAVLRAVVVQQLKPDDDTSKYHIFERLNRGGTSLTNQEVRNSVFHGEFVAFLTKLNKLPEWRKLLGKDEPDSRQKDIELLVRFFAMRDRTAYQKPMKDFLTAFMRKNRNPSQESLTYIENVFQTTCKDVLDGLGERPFRVRAGLNVAVADAVLVAFSNHLDAVPKDINNRWERLKQDTEFDKNTRQGTTDEETVRARFERAESILFG
jgi:hypothetical protein